MARRNARSAPPPHRGRRAGHRSLEFLASALGSLPRFSAEIGSRTPPLSSPGPPRIPPGRPPCRCSGGIPALCLAIQNFTPFLIAFWLPKYTKIKTKMHKQCMRFQSSFSLGSFLIFGRFFGCFSSRPTLDLTAICSTFVGCGIFRQVGTTPKNDPSQFSI